MVHAWCRDPSRDERVRAAEDGRTRPLPTLGECIDGMFPKSVSATSPVEHENKGDGMATERVTLEERITLEFSFDHRSNFRPKEWAATFLPGAVCQGISVRVVEDDRILAASKKLIEVDQEAALRGFDTTTFQRLWISTIARVLGLELARPPRSKCDNPGDGSIPSPGILASPALVEAHQQIAALTAERDAAIRERDEVRQSWLRSEESGTRLLAQRNAALDDAGALRKRVAHLEDGNRALKDAADAACDLLDQSNARVAALEAARGGGEGEPDAWGIVRDGNVESVTHRRFRRDADEVAEQFGGTVVPLYRSPLQPRGWLTEEEREAVEFLASLDAPPCLDAARKAARIGKELLARSTPPEVDLPISLSPIDEELIRAALAAAGVAVKEVGN